MAPRTRRPVLIGTAVALPAGSAAASGGSAWDALRAGGLVLFRHAAAPGAGDPPGMRLDDCSTQRNLDAAGRAQARRIGEAVRAAGVAVGVNAGRISGQRGGARAGHSE